MVTYKKRLQVEACGEIDRSNPLETPEILVARVYATSVNMQVRSHYLVQHNLSMIMPSNHVLYQTNLSVQAHLPVLCVGHGLQELLVPLLVPTSPPLEDGGGTRIDEGPNSRR